MALHQPRVISITTGTILRTVGILLALAVAWAIRDILLIVFTAMLLAGVVYPFAHWAESKKIPKGIAVFLFYLVIFGAIVAVFGALVPAVIDQLRSLVTSEYGRSALFSAGDGSIVNTLQSLPIGSLDTTSVFQNISDQAGSLVSSAFGTLGTIFGGIVTLFAVLVLSFYMILEESSVKNVFVSLVPARYQSEASHIVSLVIERLGGWMRGQLVLVLVIGVLSFIAYTIIGIPYALLLALLAGLLEFIPYIGPFLAAVPAVILAFSISPKHGAFALLANILIQRVENDVIVPKVMQRAVGLNPIVSLVAFMVGAQLFGVPGAIFAIPLATAIAVVTTEVMKLDRKSKSA